MVQPLVIISYILFDSLAGGIQNRISHEQDSKLFAMDRQKRRSNRSIARYDHS